jgi:hypothetical protein
VSKSGSLPKDVAEAAPGIVHDYLRVQRMVLASSASGVIRSMEKGDPQRHRRLVDLMSRYPELRAPAVHRFLEGHLEYSGGRVYPKGEAPKAAPIREERPAPSWADLGIKPARNGSPRMSYR